MNRDKQIQNIRPTLSIINTDKKPLELFQNETLRPILKLQHELTLSLLLNHKNYNPDKVSDTTKNQYQAYLIKYIQTNRDLKNQLLGAIIGLFSSIEIAFYNNHKKELNKRIIQIQINRFVDTLYLHSEVKF